jgi:5-hydroxyisourate hydrolase
MGRLSTHVLDTVAGKPAAGVKITLYRLGGDGAWLSLLETQTNGDGRTDQPLLDATTLLAGTYTLNFHISDYFKARNAEAGQPGASQPPFLDIVPIRFTITDADGHYHVPLLATPWSYTTYRGS